MSDTTLGWSLMGWLFGGAAEHDAEGDIRHDRRSPHPPSHVPADAAATALPDAELLTRLRCGDEAAFEQWYRVHHAALWRFARSLVASSPVASDVVQDVLASLWTRRATVVIRSTVTAYVYGAIRQRAFREHRHGAVVQRAERDASTTGETWGMSAAPVAADARLAEGERSAALARAVLALPARQREALLLWLEHELATAEIADILGVSDRAVRKLLEKARDHLRAALVAGDST